MSEAFAGILCIKAEQQEALRLTLIALHGEKKAVPSGMNQWESKSSYLAITIPQQCPPLLPLLTPGHPSKAAATPHRPTANPNAKPSSVAC